MRDGLSCERVEVGTAEYLDGALPTALHGRFTAHLERCRECGDHLRRIHRTIDHLRALPREPMPPRLKVRLLRAARLSAPSPAFGGGSGG